MKLDKKSHDVFCLMAAYLLKCCPPWDGLLLKYSWASQAVSELVSIFSDKEKRINVLIDF